MELTSRPGLLGIEVATWGWRRDRAWSSRRSRPGKEVTTWPGGLEGEKEVATSPWSRDLGGHV